MSADSDAVYPGFMQPSETSEVVDELLVAERAALIVVDAQNDYCHPDGALGRAGYDLSTIDPMCDVIETLLGAARAAGVAVVFLRNAHSEFTDTPAWKRKSKHSMAICREGTWGSELYRLVPLPEEPVIPKHRYSGFIGTRLPQVLGAKECTTLVFTGTSTHVCVESTARDACMLDYDVVVVSDAVAATDQEAHLGTLSNIERFFGHVVPSEAVLAAWRSVVDGTVGTSHSSKSSAG